MADKGKRFMARIVAGHRREGKRNMRVNRRGR